LFRLQTQIRQHGGRALHAIEQRTVGELATRARQREPITAAGVDAPVQQVAARVEQFVSHARRPSI